MAESIKKAKTPAKPRKTTTKKQASPEAARPKPTHEEIAELARRYWAERGWKDGHAEEDWLRAERALLELAS
ncbi:DUF2934 domain-containing protein [Silvibacterium dinghuense]|uniref:DUF2934 domain-containing protein n=1 Tax=Silvibacterium dinghuense TaxID=1560006 RepID=A0A4Q1SD51_9BACT|nr:DUF2934 domain-containing protein [Silvibacterium dinghuense]RXS94971.1 DUF2934 domain-containing protein [Silvibacterium dinghuense]GGH09472.1 hypothetical protein GCM10011586_27490 [Silvibacterium dinghuense]